MKVGEKEVLFLLAKNPVGLNQALRQVVHARPPALLIVLNDHFADGRDVSWIWDADLEMLAGQVPVVIASGTRAEDMALRLRYAGIEAFCEKRLAAALSLGLEKAGSGEALYILPTYTALLETREFLARAGHVRHFWEKV